MYYSLYCIRCTYIEFLFLASEKTTRVGISTGLETACFATLTYFHELTLFLFYKSVLYAFKIHTWS